MPIANLTADALNQHEPQRVNNAKMSINNLDGADQLEIALESFPIPKRSVGIIEMGHLNEKRKVAGNPVYDDLSVVYKDLVTVNVARIFNAWWELVHDAKTGKTGFARDYKKSAVVTLFAPDGTELRSWDCIGVWPSAFDPGDIDMSGEDFVRITATLTIDKCVPAAGIA